MSHWIRRAAPAAVIGISLILASPAAFAVRISSSTEPQLEALVLPFPGTTSPTAGVADVSDPRVQALRRQPGFENWKLIVDLVDGTPTLVEGPGVPWIPNSRNTLSWLDVGRRIASSTLPEEYRAAADADESGILVSLARLYIHEHPELIPAGNEDLVLRGVHPLGVDKWSVEFDRVHGGVPVVDGYLTVRVSYGSLIHWGGSQLQGILTVSRPTISSESARDILTGYIGSVRKGDSLGEPRLLLIPVEPSSLPASWRSGGGYDHRLVWEIDFFRGEPASRWLATIDARTGEMLAFRENTAYAQVKGGVYPVTVTDPEQTWPMPYADLAGGATGFTDANGVYNYTSGTVTTTLNGQYWRINDNCGAISEAGGSPGTIDLGTSGGNDCTVPGGHSAGDTHSSRSAYYHLNRIAQKGRVYLPANAWLQSKITANVNINSTCNANWNGSALNFFRSGGGCANTGEIAGVFLHEWGHGMDSNDGNGSLALSTDAAVGEAYGDTVAMLQLHDSCMGKGFLAGQQCGYATTCTSCDGVREADYVKYNQPNPITLTGGTNPLSNFCAGFTNAGYHGRCNWEGHCESVVITQSMWDLAVRDLPLFPMDQATAWQLVDKMFYQSRPSAGSAYACTGATTAGCATNTWYKTFLVVDDCDADLTNGTPHATRIFNALNRHGIACGVSTDVANQNQAGCCPTLTKPVVTAVPSNNQVALSWGAVAGAVTYDVFRNELSCTAGYTKIANVATTNYTDNGVVNGLTYYYVVQPVPSNASCIGPLSDCDSATPVPCTAPGTPTIGTVTVPGTNQLQVSWTAGSPAGATYNIYRAILASAGDACTNGTYTLLATGDAASPYLDSTVSGTLTYGYRVTAVDSTGGCESAQSGCAKATATGTCNAAPAFAGLTSVTNPLSATCTLNLAWSAAAAYCGGPITYDVFRSTTSGFVPSGANRIATGVSAVSYSDASSLVSGTTYYYVVRAVDSANGVSDSNTVQRSGAPSGPGSGTINYASTDVPKSIPDNNATGASSTLTVTGTGAIVNILCNVNITHTYKGDLEVTLTSPLGTIVTLHNNTGGATNDVITTYDTLTAPDGPGTMNDFDGQNPAGVWTLKAVDSAAIDTGSIVGWSVDITRNSACTTGSGCTPPGAPAITGITDVSACAQSGVQIAYTGGSGATSHDLWRDGALVVTGYVSGATYNPGNTAAHSYVVQAVKSAGCTTDSPAQNGTDASAAPGAPAITGITDVNACAQSGVQIAYTAGSGAASHNLYRDAALVVTGYASGATYNPGDTASHSYVVRAISGACSTDSPAQNGVDAASCTPDLVYTTGSFSFAEVSGDGNISTLIPGEKWSVTFTVTNQGTGAAAADARLTLTGNNGLASGDFCTNPVTVGALAASATSSPITVNFILPASWAGTCLSDVQVGFISKLHNGAASAGSDQAAGSAGVAEVAKTVGISSPGAPTNLTTGPPDHDAWIRNGTDTGGHGSETILRVGRHAQTNANGNTDSLVHFDLSSIPAGSTINSAVMQLTVVAVNGITSDTFGIRQITGAAWDEATVTWANSPAFSGTNSGTIAVDGATGLKTSTDLTSLVQSWVTTPASNFGARLVDPTRTNNQYIDFASSEDATSSNRPKLVINYTPPTSSSCTAWGGSASCVVGVAEVSDDAAHALTMSKGTGATVNLSFEDIGGVSTQYNVYVSNAPNTLSFQVGSTSGKKSCAATTASAAGSMRTMTNYDPSGPADTGLLCFLVTANTQSLLDEGSAGNTSGGTPRTCSSWCARP